MKSTAITKQAPALPIGSTSALVAVATSSLAAAAGKHASRTAGVAAAVLALLAAVLVFASPAHADTTFGESGEGTGGLDIPAGIAVSQEEGGDIYVADSQNQRIDQFTPTGAWVRAFGWGVATGSPELQTCTTSCQRGLIEGAEPGRFNYPDKIAIDNDPTSSSYGDVYVIDQTNYRVEKYGPAGEFLLIFGGGVDRGPHHPGDVCTAAYLAEGDACGGGIPGTAPSHFYEEEPLTEAGGFKRWSGNNSIAVGPDGTVYVGDYGRIQEFAPTGAFAGEFKLPDAEPRFVVALAVDSAGDIYEHSATLSGAGTPAESEVPGVREFSPAHVLIRTLAAESGGEPAEIALDATGHLFVAGRISGEFQLRAFDSAGLYAVIEPEQTLTAAGIAVDGESDRLYTPTTTPNPEHSTNGQPEDLDHITALTLPSSGPPLVTEQQAADVEPTTATLQGTINPRGFATEYHFEYGETPAYGHSVAPADATLDFVNRRDHVQFGLSGLSTATTYHWRLVAESECEPTVNPGHICVIDGADQTFSTLPAASVREFTTQTVGPELVALKAELNPNNSPTSYTIRYGLDTSYSGGSFHGTLPAGNEFKSLTATFAGLQPNTEYHYQLVAANENGPGGHGAFETADQTFTTELSAAEERAAEDCPNTTLREENNSLALPECRAYEQVSAVEKGGGDAGSGWLAPGGERVLYFSNGVFAGAQVDETVVEYVAHRTEAGWLSQAVIGRPAPLGYEPASVSPLLGGFYSAELDRTLFLELPGLSSEAARGEGGSAFYTLGLEGGSYVLHATPNLGLLEGEPRSHFAYTTIEGQSEDLTRLFVVTAARLLPEPEDPRPDDNLQDASRHTRIYEISGVGGPSPTMRLVAEVPLGLTLVKNNGSATDCSLDSQAEIPLWARRTSADGSTLFYTVPIEHVPGTSCGEGSPNPIGLFARIGEAPPVQLNLPPASECSSLSPCATAAPADPKFYGTSPDGHLAWFSTAQSLVNSDRDSSPDLYLAELEGGHLTQLVQASLGDATDPHPGEGADVKEVGPISQDGSHVAFIATGILTSHPNSSGDSAVQGADNLYVYAAADGEVRFVGSLCSGAGQSGAQVDSSCPAGDASDNQFLHYEVESRPSAEFTPDGRYLLFSTVARLEPGDSDAVSDAYRYDTETGQLIRVSIGRDGNDGNGNDNAYPTLLASGGHAAPQPSALAADGARSISADGSVVVFATAAPLVSHDTNAGADPSCENHGLGANASKPTGCDAYEWQEDGHGTCRQAGGCTSLLSDGVAPLGIGEPLPQISSTGRDATFETASNLVPGDVDGVGDVYDARVDGGFQPLPLPPHCGSSETCPGSPPPTPPPPRITTENQTPGNGAQQLSCSKGKVRQKRHGQVRCVAKKDHKGKQHHKSKNHHQRAGHNQGGGK